jgi:hypothetical protein
MYNVADCWRKILVQLEELRNKNGLVKMFAAHLTGEDLFGLNEPTVVRMIESVSHPNALLRAVDLSTSCIDVVLGVYVMLCVAARLGADQSVHNTLWSLSHI